MNIALVLSGGTGSRMGAEMPKQYMEVGGKPMVSYCMETLTACGKIDGIQIVAAEAWRDFIRENVRMEKVLGFSMPGKTRQLSILNGLEDILHICKSSDAEEIPEDAWVFIHDAARPMLDRELVSDCFTAAEGHDGVLPVLPMKDTVYFSEDGVRISSGLDRSKVFAGQAPELFRLEPYYRANTALLPERILRINGSTEPAVLAGMDIVMIPGDERNFKVTTKEDLERLRLILEGDGK